jgi:streptomycin 3"-adenylyltransferase
LYYLKEGKVASKREGGEWGVAHLPQEFQPLVKECLQAYNEAAISGDSGGKANVQTLLAYANYMTREIERANVTKSSQA